jgi:hypothetical protein
MTALDCLVKALALAQPREVNMPCATATQAGSHIVAEASSLEEECGG